ncbi:MAG: MFS transporter [Thermoanaerobaculia bacterium]
MSSGDRRDRSNVLSALGHRNYRLYFFGQLISLTGTWMQSVAQAWLAYELTHSAALLGIVGFAGQIPALVFSPAGGVVADRFARRRILLATQTTSMLLAFALAALTLSGKVTIAWILTLAAISGIVNAFDIPTRQAFAVDMVGRADLMNAIALNSSIFNGARVVGPAVAGLLVARIGEGWCFLANGVSYLAVLGSLLAMRLPAHTRAADTSSAWTSVRAGFVYVAGAQPVRALLLLLGLVSLTGMPYAVLMPVFAKEILGGGAHEMGLLMGCSGAGALAGAVVLASRKSVKGLGTFVALSAGSLGVALIAFSFSHVFWLSAILLVPVGFFMMSEMASSNTLIQSMIPDEMRGRVMSVYAMMFMGMAPLGALLAGSLAARIGAPATVASGGAICLVGSLVFARRLPHLRVHAHRMIVELQMAAGDPPEEPT